MGLGGSAGYNAFIFDRESGNLTKRLSGLKSSVNHLAFSENGRYLAVCLHGENGVFVYRTSDWSLAFSDASYKGATYAADFDSSGRLATASYDGLVRLYDASFALVAKKTPPGGIRPFSVAFSPDGSRLAVGFNDTAKVDVLSGRDLSLLHSPDCSDIDNGNMGAVAWSSDGRVLYAGGRYLKKFNGVWFEPIRAWKEGGRGSYTDLPAAHDTIMQILPLSGGIVFGSGDASFGAYDGSGTRAFYKNPAISDFRNNKSGFLVSRDGSTIRFAYEIYGKNPAVFSVKDRTLKTGNADASELAAPVTSTAGLALTNWDGELDPKLNGVPLKIDRFERSRSVAILPGGKSFLLGSEWNLRLFDDKGKELWKISAPGTTWNLNVSGDGEVAVAAFADGTVHWFRVSDGKELLAFFPHNDRKRWVLWTPSGYYASSPGADDLVGWHMNNGADEAADFFPVSKFKASYYRPDVVERILRTRDEKEALRLADNEAGKKSRELALDKMVPPVVTIVSPADDFAASKPEVTVRFSLRTPSGEAVTAVRALVDGRPASSERGLSVVAGRTGGERELRVGIPERDCEISVIAENRYASSEPATVRIRWAGAKRQEEFVIKPKLYVLAVGVSKYRDPALALGLAAKDAMDFAATLASQKGGLYRDVSAKVLTDESATKDDILDGLDWIRKETTSKDVAMVFFAGHGVNDQSGIYYYLPVNANTDKLMRTGVAFSDIRNTVASLAGKTLFFVDTCHSGNVMGTRRGVADIAAVVNELASTENGAVVFASSTGNQYSLEDRAWGNGAFTKALVEGLSGKADYAGTGKISVNMLDLYLSERVKELTKGRQTPTTTKPRTVPDFPIAVRK